MSVKNYKMFVENYEEIMQNIGDEVDVNKINAYEGELSAIKDKIDAKKIEVEKQLENLENLEVETFTEDNQEIVAKKKVEIGETIEKLKADIEAYQLDIEQTKEKLLKIKEMGK